MIATFAHAAEAIPEQKVDQPLHDRLPAAIKTSGKMISVNNGSFPPYEIVNGPHSMDGASADLTVAPGLLLGVKIEHARTVGAADRYQLAIGPPGNYPDRQQKVGFIDFVQEFVVLACKKAIRRASTASKIRAASVSPSWRQVQRSR